MRIIPTALFSLALLLSSCASDISSIQTDSPANAYKDYKAENANNASVIGVGEPISKQQMRANATLQLKGLYSLQDIMDATASTYNVAIRWGAGVRRVERENVLISELTFDEARSYIEDVYNVQIIREGERRLLVLPSISEDRITDFNPGVGISLAEVLRGLATQCGTNLVLTENDAKLESTLVTARLQDITCYDAYEALLAPHGLSLVDKGGFAILSGLPQRQWVLDLYEPIRTEETEVSYQSEFEGSGSEETGDSGTQSAGGKNIVTVTNERDLWTELQTDLSELLASACNTVSSVNPDATIQQDMLLPPETDLTATQDLSLDTELSEEGTEIPSSCGYVRVNRSVGMVQMQASRATLDQADDMINRIKDIASRRLLLEARVIAVTRSREFTQTANLGGAATDDYNTANVGFSGALNSVTATLSGRLASLNQSGGFFSVKNSRLDAVVGLAEEFGTTYQLMQPTMELMDRQRGTMIDGTNRVFFTRTTETETTDTGTIRNTEANTFTQFSGLQFSATAQVAGGNEPHTISLQIPITDISGVEQIPQVVDGETLNDSVPIVNTRMIDQKVRIRDGEIKVIGGLTKVIAIDKESGTPLLRNTPAIGTLFGEEDIEYEEVEFVVLLQVRRLY